MCTIRAGRRSSAPSSPSRPNSPRRRSPAVTATSSDARTSPSCTSQAIRHSKEFNRGGQSGRPIPVSSRSAAAISRRCRAGPRGKWDTMRVSAMGESQSSRHGGRRGVLGQDHAEQLGHIVMGERPLHRCPTRLGREAVAPLLGVEHPADLDTGPVVPGGPVRPGPARSACPWPAPPSPTDPYRAERTDPATSPSGPTPGRAELVGKVQGGRDRQPWSGSANSAAYPSRRTDAGQPVGLDGRLVHPLWPSDVEAEFDRRRRRRRRSPCPRPGACPRRVRRATTRPRSSTSHWMTSALMKPRSKSVWIRPAACGRVEPARKVQARLSFSPVVRNVRRPSWW